MDTLNTQSIALLILKKSGVLEYRPDLINFLENELSIIYSEIDNSKPPELKQDEPMVYYKPVLTLLDLVAGGQIFTPLYKLISIDERSFIRKITHHNDFYVNVERGSKHNFIQTWTFNFIFEKKLFNIEDDLKFKFFTEIGVRSPFPYKIYTSNIDEILIEQLYDHIKNL